MYRTSHKIFKTNLEEFDLQYTICDSFFRSFETKDIIKELGKSKDYFVFSNVDEKKSDLFSIFNRTFRAKVEKETPNSLYIDKVCILGAKSYSFIRSIDKENKTKLKRIQTPAKIELGYKHYHNCLLGEGEDR